MKLMKWLVSKAAQIAKTFLPFAYIARIHKNSNALPHMRMNIKFFVSLSVLALFTGLSVVFGLLYLKPLLTPIIGQFPAFLTFVGSIFYSAFLGAELGHLLAKYTMRANSWISSKSTNTTEMDPENFCPTHPDKYRGKSQKALRTLCQKKTQIKENTEAWVGLTSTERQHCKSINFAVSVLRNSSLNELNSCKKPAGYQENYINGLGLES